MAAGDKIKGQRKPEDFIGHRNRDKSMVASNQNPDINQKTNTTFLQHLLLMEIVLNLVHILAVLY